MCYNRSTKGTEGMPKTKQTVSKSSIPNKVGRVTESVFTEVILKFRQCYY